MNKYLPVIIASLILGVFAVAGTTLVSFTYENTKDRIEENKRLALLKQLTKLVPAQQIDNDIVADSISVSAPDQLGQQESRIYLGRKNAQPVAAVFESTTHRGYSGDINLLVAVMHDGTLGGVRVISHKETPGLGDKVDENRSDWILSFAGKSLSNPSPDQWKVKRDGGYFDQFTGATITPRAVVEAVRKTLDYYRLNQEKIFTSTPPALPATEGY